MQHRKVSYITLRFLPSRLQLSYLGWFFNNKKLINSGSILFVSLPSKLQLLAKMVTELINANPIIYEKKERRAPSAPSAPHDEYAVEPIDQQEVFDILF